jgi:hypothetical protein
VRLGRRGPARRRSTVTGEHSGGGSGSRRGEHGLGQHAALGVVLGAREASGVVGQWGGRAALAHGGDRRRRSRRLGVRRGGGQIDANKRACELAWVLRKRTEGLDGGEHEQGELAPAAAGWRRQWRGCSVRRARRGRGLLYPARAARG